jgi:hypothetical protein
LHDSTANALGVTGTPARVEPAESRDGLGHHRLDMSVVGDVEGNGKDLVAISLQFVRRGANVLLIPVGQYDGRPRFSESFRVAKPRPDAAPVMSAAFSSNEMFMMKSFHC